MQGNRINASLWSSHGHASETPRHSPEHARYMVMNQVDPMADRLASLTPFHYSYNNPSGFVDTNGALPWSADFEENYTGLDYGTRRMDALNRGKGQMGEGLSEAGWDGVVGSFGLSESGYGFGSLYSNPSTVVDANYGAEQAAKLFTYLGKAVQVGVHYENPVEVLQYVARQNETTGIGGLVHVGTSGKILSMTSATVISGDGTGWISTSNTNVLDLINSDFKFCLSCLNPATLYQNLGGLSYPGGDNPLDFSNRYSYSYVPINLAEYPAIGHDRRYDNLKTEGIKGLLMDTRAIGADWRFVNEEMQIAFSNVDFGSRFSAAILGGGLGLMAMPKTIFQLSSPGGYMKIIMDFQVSSIGVTNNPDR